MKKKVLISLLGPKLDIGTNPTRWEKWRPSVAICQQENFMIDRYELLYQENFQLLADIVQQDIADISPHTKIQPHIISIKDPWDFEEVYATLYDFALNYPFQKMKNTLSTSPPGPMLSKFAFFYSLNRATSRLNYCKLPPQEVGNRIPSAVIPLLT